MPADVPAAPAVDLAPKFEELWLPDLQTAAKTVNWLWGGYLAPGNVTLLTGLWRAGKTTLTAALLAHMQSGGLLAGAAVRPGKVVVVSEESRDQWRQRSDRFALGTNVCWICRPFRGKPRQEQWLALLDRLLDLHRRFTFDLVIVDTIATLLPNRSESDAASMLQALVPLQRLTAAGLAVLLLHHPRRQVSADGQWARGSGALCGFADILIEMHHFSSAADDDRRRKMLAFSRFDETPRRLVVELDESGTDYVALGDIEDAEFHGGWEDARHVLEGADRRLTRDDILQAWPENSLAPSAKTLWRWLERTVAQGQLRRDGTGKSGEPFRYWLAEREAEWRKQPLGPAQWQADHDLLRRMLGMGSEA